MDRIAARIYIKVNHDLPTRTVVLNESFQYRIKFKSLIYLIFSFLSILIIKFSEISKFLFSYLYDTCASAFIC